MCLPTRVTSTYCKSASSPGVYRMILKFAHPIHNSSACSPEITVTANMSVLGRVYTVGAIEDALQLLQKVCVRRLSRRTERVLIHVRLFHLIKYKGEHEGDNQFAPLEGRWSRMNLVLVGSFLWIFEVPINLFVDCNRSVVAAFVSRAKTIAVLRCPICWKGFNAESDQE